jgi:hypothetical protein
MYKKHYVKKPEGTTPDIVKCLCVGLFPWEVELFDVCEEPIPHLVKRLINVLFNKE